MSTKQVNKWMVLTIISIGIFMSTLDGSIVSIANPTIASELGIDLHQIQWITTAYMLVVTSTMLFFGKLGDKIGGQYIYSVGFLLFAVGSFFCSQASSLVFLILARIFQAVGGSMLMATGVGIVSNAFPAEERGKALGITGTIVGIGNVSGPSIGGFILAHFHWSMIFLINIPIGVLAFLLGLKFLPAQPLNKEIKSFDIPGILMFAIAASMLLFNINQLDHLQILPVLVLLVALAGFLWREKHFDQSFLDFVLFKDYDFTFGNIIGVLSYMPQMAVTFLLPFYLQDLWQYSALKSGLVMSVSPICMAILAPIAGTLSDKWGSRKLLLFSFASSTIGFIGLSFLKNDSPLPYLIGMLILLGIGFGCFGSPNNSSILAHVPPQKQGYGGSFLSTVRNLSYAMGTAFFSWFFTWRQTLYNEQTDAISAYVSASNFTYRFIALFTLVGFLLTFFLFERQSAQKSTPTTNTQKNPA